MKESVGWSVKTRGMFNALIIHLLQAAASHSSLTQLFRGDERPFQRSPVQLSLFSRCRQGECSDPALSSVSQKKLWQDCLEVVLERLRWLVPLHPAPTLFLAYGCVNRSPGHP